MKVVCNKCHGGFSLSAKAVVKMREMGSKHALQTLLFGEKDEKGRTDPYDYKSYLSDIPRYDAYLVAVVELLGDEASGQFARLRIVDVPDEEGCEIEDYDGFETVREPSRIWG